MEKHKVICPYCGAGCQFNLLVQNGQVVGTMVYTDGGPENYSVNMIGVMMEIKL